MPLPFKYTIESDCAILLMRALFKQKVVAFGEDGFGKHGTCNLAQYYEVKDITVHVDEDIPYDISARGSVMLHLSGYSAKDFGHIATDRNFLISVTSYFKEWDIDETCVSYAPIDQQPDDGVMMIINISKILHWS